MRQRAQYGESLPEVVEGGFQIAWAPNYGADHFFLFGKTAEAGGRRVTRRGARPMLSSYLRDEREVSLVSGRRRAEKHLR